MPRFLLPRRSTPHRVAAIALYRALLSRCSSVPLPDEVREPLRNAIVTKFRRNRKIMNAYNLGLAFRAGYETLDHLDAACAGDSKSASFIANTVSELPPRLKRIRRTKQRPPENPHKKLSRCPPPEKALLRVRPYKNLTGPRHVPILAHANGIPFLRIKKPQPPSLSRVLRQKLDSRTFLFDRRTLLTHYWLPIATNEDEWDELLEHELGLEEDSEQRWVDAFSDSLADNAAVYEAQLKKTAQIARRMLKIVDLETELALKEGQKVIRGRHKSRKQP